MAEPEKKGCIGRNWKWMLPVGCLGIMLVCGGGLGSIFYGTMSVLKSTDAYTEAVKIAKANPEVEAALGTPISEGFMVGGTFNNVNGTTTADLKIPLSGPNGSGTLNAKGSGTTGGKWTYTTLDFEPKSGATIDLLK